MLDSRSMGAPLVEALETTGVLNGGRKITYALGVVVTNENGQRKVAHGGSTAGYQTFLSRYPDLKLSIAVMCNGTSRNPAGLEREIFNEIAGPFPAPKSLDTIALKPEELQNYVGLWRNEKTHMPERTIVENGLLRLAGQAVLRPLRDGSFLSGSSRVRFQMGANGKPASNRSRHRRSHPSIRRRNPVDAHAGRTEILCGRMVTAMKPAQHSPLPSKTAMCFGFSARTRGNCFAHNTKIISVSAWAQVRCFGQRAIPTDESQNYTSEQGACVTCLSSGLA